MKQTALLVIDFINDIVDLKGTFTATAKFVDQHHVMDRANEVIAFARKQQIPLIFIRVGFEANYVDCPLTSPLFGEAKKHQALALNTWGTEFHKHIHIEPHDLIMRKPRVSAFYGTPLEPFLRANHIQHLILTGVSTSMAIQTTAREAHDRDYLVSIIADACGDGSMDSHIFTLKQLESIATVLHSSGLST